MNITQTANSIYLNNCLKGFWQEERNFGEMLMLVTSELGEALEAHRKGKICEKGLAEKVHGIVDDEEFKKVFTDIVKDTVADEICDAVIRLFDVAYGTGIDLEAHIKAKMRYNAMRPHKHGKKY